MNNNFIIMSNTGVIQDESLTAISKGNDKVDILYFAFAGHTYNNAYATITATFPNGITSVELATIETTFEFEDVTYNGYKYTFTNYLTSQAGNLTITIRLKSNTDGTVLCSTQKALLIRDTDVPTDPSITPDQYEELLAALESKLNKNYSDLDSVDLDNLDDSYLVVNDNTIPKKVKFDDTVKIKTVNNVAPDENKNITITTENINHNNTQLKAKIDSIDSEIDRLDGRIDDVEDYVEGKLDKNFSGDEYPTYAWDDLDDDEYVAINKNVNGETITGKAKLQDLYNKVNGVAPVDGNISIDAEDIPYNNSNVKDTLDYAVYYADDEQTQEPATEVLNAKNDILGNQIDITYETKQHAAETYAAITDLEQFENEVSSTYETKANAEATYETKEDALSKQTAIENEIETLETSINGKQNIIDANNKLSYLFINGLSNVASSGSYNDLLNKPTFTTSGLQAVSVSVGSQYTISGTYDLYLISINTNGINEFKVLIPNRAWEKGEVYNYNKNTYDSNDEQYGRFIVWANASSNGITISAYRDDTITYNMSGETVSSTTISKGVKRTSGTLSISYIGVKF